MNNIIRKVEISAFRSIEKEVIKCSEVNVFCGANDSGKSNILRALNLFFNNQTDFLTPLRFIDDYNKVALAKAVRATKMKQQIKVRVYLNPPPTFKSLIREKEVYIERIYDRNGAMSESYSNEKKKSIIIRLFNRINYLYIPALKGKEVLQYILGLIGEYELIDQGDIESLNDKISLKTVDLSSILKGSGISINTTFGLPTFLADFWQKLSVDTAFDQTDFIRENIQGARASRDLNTNSFKIPLTSRGEGIKSKYVPPLLSWLSKNNPEEIYVWGIDEPENSLEFGLGEELANLYYNDYSSTTQCFLTTHSLAFINPEENVKNKPGLFRCRKDEYGSTEIFLLSDFIKAELKLELFEELGVLEFQKRLMEDFRRYKRDRGLLKNRLIVAEKELGRILGKTKCIVLTEDKDQEPIKLLLESSGFKMDETEVRPYEGCTNISAAKVLHSFIKEKFPKMNILIHRDRDYQTDEEVSETEEKFKKYGLNLFVTKGTDVESYFLNARHVNFMHPEISIDAAQVIINEVFTELYRDSVDNILKKDFGEKYISKFSHARNYLKSLPREEPERYTKGKNAIGLLKSKVKQATSKKANARLLFVSKFLVDSNLHSFSEKIWPKSKARRPKK